MILSRKIRADCGVLSEEVNPGFKDVNRDVDILAEGIVGSRGCRYLWMDIVTENISLDRISRRLEVYK